jgi:hypothetical protein
MMDLTFMIPCKLESADRVRNLTTVISFLLSNFNAKIAVKEYDVVKNFESSVLPILKDKFKNLDKLNYSYMGQTTEFFHKTRVLNELLLDSDTEVVCNYDTDVILPVKSIIKAYTAIKDGVVDAIYPYGVGAYQKAVAYTPEVFLKFISSNMQDADVSKFQEHSRTSSSTIGWCQFIRRENYINSFMMNENFAAWGPEDCELFYRLNVMGNKVGRVNDFVYHLEHSRSTDSWFSNPLWQQNTQLWEWIRRQDKETLINYYKKQDYIKRRK